MNPMNTVALLCVCTLLCTDAIAASKPTPQLYLEAPLAFGGAVWFPQELEPVSDAVAQLLASRPYGGYRVVPNADVRALWTDVANGKLPGVSLTCDLPPPPSRLVRQAYPDAMRASLAIRCKPDTCGLEVVVRRPSSDEELDEEVARWTAALGAEGNPVAWAQEVARQGLKRTVPPPKAGVVGGVVGVSARCPEGGTCASLAYVQQSGPWGGVMEEGPFQPFAADLEGCKAPGQPRLDSWAQYFLLEVSAGGRVERCEHNVLDHLPPPEFSCQCEVLKRIDFGEAAPGRRASVDLRTHVPGKRTVGVVQSAYLLSKNSDDRSAVLGPGSMPLDALSKCLSSVDGALLNRPVAVRFNVGPDGRAKRFSGMWPVQVEPATRACLDQAMMQARFNCPLTGRATVTGSLSLRVSAAPGK